MSSPPVDGAGPRPARRPSPPRLACPLVPVAVAVAVFVSVLVAVLLGGGAVAGDAAASPVTVVGPVQGAFAELPAPEPPADESRRRADDILARAEFQDPPESIGDRILRWILERLGELLEGLGMPGGSAAGKGANPLAWLLLIVLVGVIIFLIARWRGSLGSRRRDREPLFATELEAMRTATEWLHEAERFELSGQWKAALRCRYRALIGELIDRGVVRDLPGRTSGEFRVDVRRRASGLSAPFGEATDLFDAVWYGDRPTGEAQNRTFVRLAEEILAAAPPLPRYDEPESPAPSADEVRNQMVAATSVAPATGGLATGLPDRGVAPGEAES